MAHDIERGEQKGEISSDLASRSREVSDNQTGQYSHPGDLAGDSCAIFRLGTYQSLVGRSKPTILAIPPQIAFSSFLRSPSGSVSTYTSLVEDYIDLTDKLGR